MQPNRPPARYVCRAMYCSLRAKCANSRLPLGDVHVIYFTPDPQGEHCLHFMSLTGDEV